MKTSLLERIQLYKDRLNFRRRRIQIDKPRLFKRVLVFALFFGTVGLAFWLNAAFGNRYIICDYSMLNTVYYQDHVLVDQFRYKIFTPDENEVIAFYPKGNFSGDISVKRIIACPGDTVLISKGKIYVNGEVYSDTIIADSINYSGLAADTITLGEDEFFVLGDNRNNSQDSRYTSCDRVKKEYIVGKVWLDITASHFRLVY